MADEKATKKSKIDDAKKPGNYYQKAGTRKIGTANGGVVVYSLPKRGETGRQSYSVTRNTKRVK